jgi:hypothetical protein
MKTQKMFHLMLIIANLRRKWYWKINPHFNS